VIDHQLVRLRLDELQPSPGFSAWLDTADVAIALTKGNSLVLIGRDPEDSLSFTDCQFGMCMGLTAVGSDTLFLATRYQIWRLENALPPGRVGDAGHDRLLLPQTAWTTGTLLVRDLKITPDGRVMFVNGLFSCLATPSQRLNFEPAWLPPFISRLAPDDRCHLSGLALEDGRPAFVTSASRSDRTAGWREDVREGGVVVSVPAGDLVAVGLSMPCSPVLRDRRLWLCLGGSGELATIDLEDGTVTRVAALPGFARGLALLDGHAVVGVSGPHRGETFTGLPLVDRLPDATDNAKCGIFVVELESGRIEHSLLFSGASAEIHAVAVLPGVRSGAAVPFTGTDVQELVAVPTHSPLSKD
jgi:uncharacterized protein (TIGR03032 family)